MNSREKGKRGELRWRDELRANGYRARRGQQFAGGAESPDVVCDDLPWAHFEVKAVERLNVYDAIEQARRDCGPVAPAGQRKVPIVAHRRNRWPWLVTMDAETFFKFLRGELPPTERQKAEGTRQNGTAENAETAKNLTADGADNADVEEGLTWAVFNPCHPRHPR